ncbi:CAP domain-containing protein [Sporomusa acidovorans]|uniref:SCP domain-containing protein n=1 Tax=Sporomusa acidovorans (strain ATCC 49682 / DSM 3132 / Mol) TaxID=1123286 RepID=A0ABZ3J5W8_SPOA4|nr:CAP domain-containing protein [Sporomusa acidovorans]OZC21042.1 cysteine-rich secretory protein family protein [Sporomusa acidovorans DSM 3132]SDF17667.1 Cysteine-rich secretory protein family protein [Sporomusa acidovorans]
MRKPISKAVGGLVGTIFGLYAMAVPLATPAYAQVNNGYYNSNQTDTSRNQDPVEVVKAAASRLGFNAASDKFALTSKNSTTAVVSVIHNGTTYKVTLQARGKNNSWIIASVKAVKSGNKPTNGNNNTPSQDPTGTGSTTTTTTTTNSNSNNVTALEQQAVDLLNADRKANGLPALQADSRVTTLARNYAQDMINRNYFSHYNPEGQSPFDRLKQAGISYSAAGENIAVNQSIEKAETAFMNSSGHRANILNSSYTKVGIGVAYDKSGNIYIVQDFIKP